MRVLPTASVGEHGVSGLKADRHLRMESSGWYGGRPLGWSLRAIPVALALHAGACAALVNAGPGIARVVTLVPPLPLEWNVPDSFVVWDSFVARTPTRELRPQLDFRLDLLRAKALFQPSLAESTVKVGYRFLPLGLPVVIRHRLAPTPGEAAPTVTTPRPSYPADLSTETELRVSGTKTIGVRFGAGRDPSLDQALHVQVAGTLAGDVEVRASLSDESTPIQPEGTTQELRELDRVVIEMRRKESSLSVGDCAVTTEGFRFLHLQRKTQGAAATLVGGEWRGTFAVASSKGLFASVEIEGVEGSQGPYSLSQALGGARGSMVVLAGTERVYLDGQPMTRGVDRDYTIDYATGELTFTERHRITSHSRIAVDFQYTTQSFRRALYAATVRRPIGRMATVRLGAFREADDPSQPLEWTVGEAEREALRAAGDAPGGASVPTYRFVGFGLGTYDTLHVSFLVPSPGGGWTARFDSVGGERGSYRRVGQRFEYFGPRGGPFVAVAESTGVGDYARQTAIILVPGGTPHEVPEGDAIPTGSDRSRLGGSFEATFLRARGGDYVRTDVRTWTYVGPGHGDYVASRTLPSPKRHQAAVLGVQAGGGALRVDIEAAVSDFDANTLSPLDDADNASAAVEAHAIIGGGSRGWQTSLAWRSQGVGFTVPDRARPVDWERAWSLTTSGGSEDEGSLDVTLSGARGRLGLTFGQIRRGATSSRRIQTEGAGKGPGALVLAGRFNLSRGEGTRWWTDGSVDRQAWWAPIVTWKGERSAMTGQGYFDAGAGLRVGEAGTMARIVAGERIESFRPAKHEPWMRSGVGRWWHVGLASGADRANARLDLTRSQSRPTDEYRQVRAGQGVPDRVTSSLGNARLSVLPLRWGPRLELDYKVSGRQSERMVEELVPEEPWETNVGEYDSLGVWVGPDLGTHKKQLVPSGGAERVNQVEGIAALRLVPGRSPPRWRKALAGDVTIRTQLASRSDDLVGLCLLRPSVVSDDSLTLRQWVRADVSLHVQPFSQGFSIVGQASFSTDTDNRRTDRRTHRDQARTSLSARGMRLWRATIDLTAFRSHADDVEEAVAREGGSVTTTSRVYGLTPQVSLPVAQRLEAVVTGELSRERAGREVHGSEPTEATLWTAGANPGLRVSLPGKGRVLFESQVAWRKARGPWSRLAPFLRRADLPGTVRLLRVRGEYRVQEKVTLTGSLRVGREPTRGKVTEGSMELVAYL